MDEPKRERSKGAIPVIAQLRLFLERHRARSGNPHQGYILQSPQGKPLNLDALASPATSENGVIAGKEREQI